MKKFQLPFGVQDYLPEECFNKTDVENKIAKVFYSYGYERVETATLEYFDLFEGVIDRNGINRMFKMTDNDGSLLVLRPDPTLQICRMAAAKAGEDGIKKLFYIENSFEYLPDSASARTREFSQAGLELLGKSGNGGDAEAVILAIESLLSTGLKNFLIDIGHIGFYYGLAAQSGLSSADAAVLLSLIDRKDALGIETFLKNRQIDKNAGELIQLIPSLFGGEQVLDKAEKSGLNEISLSAVKSLRAVIDTLKIYGYEKYVSVDLGLIKGGYYSGIVFRAIASDLGVSILDGGRYDKLCDKFSEPTEAIGFSIGIKRLLKALDSQNSLKDLKPCDAAYITLGGICEIEKAETARLRKSGKRVIKLFTNNESELTAYCRQNKIKTALIFSDSACKQIKVE